jgi:arylsulfatase A-like enzyme
MWKLYSLLFLTQVITFSRCTVHSEKENIGLTKDNFTKDGRIVNTDTNYLKTHSINLPPPNIIFILADDLGYADLGCYGQKRVKTPNLDRMAAQGTKFTNFYAGSMVCAPSRCTLMTGQHSGHALVRSNESELNIAQTTLHKLGLIKKSSTSHRVSLRDEDFTLAEALKQAGYVTGLSGKWGLGEAGTSGTPDKQGFDEWFGFLNQSKAHNHYPKHLWSDGVELTIEENTDRKKQLYAHDLFEEYALEFIHEHRDTTFFLYLPFTLPHGSYEIADQGIYSNTNWSKLEKNYAAMVSRLDNTVGQIENLLRELDIEKNTIVFFCSDNGAPGIINEKFESNGPYRGEKHQFYEGGIRVPMLVKYPGVVPAGVISTVNWYMPDILPTLADLVGVETPMNIDGMSILQVLIGRDKEIPERSLYWESYQPELVRAGLWKNWKAVQQNPNKAIELYDLDTDPAEKNDVSSQYSDITEWFESLFEESHTYSPYWPEHSKIQSITDN